MTLFIDPVTLGLIVIASLAAGGGIALAGRWALTYRGIHVVLVDGDGGYGEVKRIVPKGNEFLLGGKGEEKARYILTGESRLTGPARPVYIIHRRHGWGLKVPTDGETVDADPRLAKLSVANPHVYRRAVAVNEWRDALEANEDGLSWIASAAPWALGALVVAVIGIVAIVFKIYGSSSV